ncbi:MAG: hypothetical protein U1A24_06125 [Cypionkella sp.]|uniref:hypothetical protein n=1 Tax=Cypionkella sp. TaxID=2811411 RepID=UPI002ABBAAFD|nr:hypothetical protein [Cypionkella sp.]MDZ4310114.1 hypothetical protein [Cypionkella sp.]
MEIVIMGKHKTEAKTKKKSSQLVIRLEKGERDAFVTLCERLDTSAAREIRRFMRELVAAHEGEVLISGIGLETAEIAVLDDATPADVAAAPLEPEVHVEPQVEVPIVETEKPKKKSSRARQ